MNREQLVRVLDELLQPDVLSLMTMGEL